MADLFLQNGFNYFDTAHGYLNGKSELAIREFLAPAIPAPDYIRATFTAPATTAFAVAAAGSSLRPDGLPR